MGRYVKLFEKDVLLKSVSCNHGRKPGEPLPPLAMLYAKVTNACNANCKFCSNNGSHTDTAPFDTDKFFKVIDSIISHDELHLGSIRFTGGEPSVVTDRVMIPLLERLSEEPYRGLFLHLNTNALHPAAHSLMLHPRWNSISVSLHHYDRRQLERIYGTDITHKIDLTPYKRDKLRLNFSCNLIRGHIDSAEKAKQMMDYAIEHGANAIGFVSLMRVNNYCNKRFIDYDEIDWKSIPSLYYSHRMDRGADCKCSDYLYNNNGQPLIVYMRNNMNPRFCESSLLFDGQHLRQGFHDNNIII